MRAAFALGILLLSAAAVHGQSNVVVEIDDVTDNRVTTLDPDAFQMAGGLELRVKLNGTGLEKAYAARVLVKEAKDDKGNSLVRSGDAPDFTPRDTNSGTLQLSVAQPARSASTVRIKGTVELYVPSRDPNARVKIDNALGKLDAPWSSKALKAAKLEITPLSREGYAAAQKARKITEKDIEKLRAEGKAQGIPEKEIELAIVLAQAMESMDGELPPGAIFLSGKKRDFDRIVRIDVLGADGTPMNISGRSLSTRGESSLMTLSPSDAPPANAAVELMLVTDKARVACPFDLKVPLP